MRAATQQAGFTKRLASPQVLGAAAAVGCLATYVILRGLGEDSLASLQALGYGAAFLVPLLGSVTIALPLPGTAAVLATAATLNPFAIAIVAAAGMTVGMAPSYALGRAGGGKLERLTLKGNGRIRGFYAKLCGLLTHRPQLASFVLAAIPNPVFDFAGLLAGAAKVPVWKFFPYTFLGRMVYILPFAFAAHLGLGFLK
jgi:membrane protein DedA with SNARE-associated domain